MYPIVAFQPADSQAVRAGVRERQDQHLYAFICTFYPPTEEQVVAKSTETVFDDACCPTPSSSRIKIKIRITMVGGICILNAALANWLFYKDNPLVGKTSALLGAVILSAPIVVAAINDAKSGKFYMNGLVALALLAGFVSGNYQEVGIIGFFMLIAIAIEEKTASGAKTSIETLVKLTPARARIVDQAAGNETEIDVKSLKINDLIRVRPGETFPADAIVVRGTSAVNEGSITGESLPVDKTKGNQVYAGTQNLTGMIEATVSAISKDSTLGKVRDLIESAEKTRPPIIRVIDRYIVYYTPVILMIGGVTWFFTQELMRVALILVMACPCALVIATPSAVVAALAAAARRGVLIKDARHLETAARVDSVVFDKTGTLTTGRLEVARLNPEDGVKLAELLKAAATAESQSNHPIANAMRDLAKTSNITWGTPDRYTEYAGKGVVAEVNGDVLHVGRVAWFSEIGVDVGESVCRKTYRELSKEMSVIHVCKNGLPLGWIGFCDAVRDSAESVVKELTQLGITRYAMITGDNESVANAIATQVGVHEVKAGCLPQTKAEYIKELKNSGATVAVVGDGVNDAPALATGDVGIAMNGINNHIAINSASIALMNNDLIRLPYLFGLSKKTKSIININVAFAGLLILGGLIIFTFGDDLISKTASVFRLNPSVFKSFVAAGIHVAGTLAVFFNSARLIRYGESPNK